MATRIIWGLILGIAFLFVCLQSDFWIVILFGIIHVIAQYEFGSLSGGTDSPRSRWHLVISSACWLVFTISLLGIWPPVLSLVVLLVAAVIYVLPMLGSWESDPAGSHAAYYLQIRSLLIITLPLAMIPVVIANRETAPWFLLLIGASWAADTGAIFAGKLAGKTALAPRLSPKKTVEGVIGGMLASGLVWAVTPMLFSVQFKQWSSPDDLVLLAPLMALAGMFLGLIGVFGDLMFSMFKREAGIKDYGSLIPGHGGVLDRFDAMIFIAPFVFLLSWLA